MASPCTKCTQIRWWDGDHPPDLHREVGVILFGEYPRQPRTSASRPQRAANPKPFEMANSNYGTEETGSRPRPLHTPVPPPPRQTAVGGLSTIKLFSDPLPEHFAPQTTPTASIGRLFAVAPFQPDCVPTQPWLWVGGARLTQSKEFRVVAFQPIYPSHIPQSTSPLPSPS